jgi:hypothetical protein
VIRVWSNAGVAAQQRLDLRDRDAVLLAFIQVSGVLVEPGDLFEHKLGCIFVHTNVNRDEAHEGCCPN